MMETVAGVDGCRGGWFVVLHDLESGATTGRIAPTFTDLLDHVRDAAMTALDMPIGLLDAAQPGGRECDREARKLLGSFKARSVFSPPARPALSETKYRDALAANRASSPHGIGISIQCFGLFPRLRQVDAVMTAELQRRVKESHPEVAFALLNGGVPLPSKHMDVGRRERRALLRERGSPDVEPMLAAYPHGPRVAEDDILDATALVHVARRILRGDAVRLPDDPRTDTRGLFMEIWG